MPQPSVESANTEGVEHIIPAGRVIRLSATQDGIGGNAQVIEAFNVRVRKVDGAFECEGPHGLVTVAREDSADAAINSYLSSAVDERVSLEHDSQTEPLEAYALVTHGKLQKSFTYLRFHESLHGDPVLENLAA